MHFKFVAVIALLAHATQSFAAPVPASYDVQLLVARGDDDKKSTKNKWKEAARLAANSVPNQALNLPVKSNVGSIAQKAIKAMQQPGQGPGIHMPKYVPPPQPAAPAPPPKLAQPMSFYKPLAPPQRESPILKQTKGAFDKEKKKNGKRDVIPELEARDFEIDELD